MPTYLCHGEDNILNLSVKKLNDLLGPEKVFQNSDGEDDGGG